MSPETRMFWKRVLVAIGVVVAALLGYFFKEAPPTVVVNPVSPPAVTSSTLSLTTPIGYQPKPKPSPVPTPAPAVATPAAETSYDPTKGTSTPK